MFRSYDHLQADKFPEFYSTDNRSVVFFRILDIIVNDYSDRFNVSRLLIDVVAIHDKTPPAVETHHTTTEVTPKIQTTRIKSEKN
jgi:hypothetical protein